MLIHGLLYNFIYNLLITMNSGVFYSQTRNHEAGYSPEFESKDSELSDSYNDPDYMHSKRNEHFCILIVLIRIYVRHQQIQINPIRSVKPQMQRVLLACQQLLLRKEYIMMKSIFHQHLIHPASQSRKASTLRIFQPKSTYLHGKVYCHLQYSQKIRWAISFHSLKKIFWM